MYFFKLKCLFISVEIMGIREIRTFLPSKGAVTNSNQTKNCNPVSTKLKCYISRHHGHSRNEGIFTLKRPSLFSLLNYIILLIKIIWSIITYILYVSLGCKFEFLTDASNKIKSSTKARTRLIDRFVIKCATAKLKSHVCETRCGTE